MAVFDYTSANYPDGDHVAWGNIDVNEVAQIANLEGFIVPEELILAEPDIVLTQTFDLDDPSQTLGIPVELRETIEAIAPVLVVTDMGPADQQVDRLVELGASLGADFNDPAIVATREAYTAKIAEFKKIVEEKG